MCNRIIDPHFENAEGFTETVNEERYRHMLNKFLRPVVIYLRNRRELWSQQDGATCYTANETMDVLQRMFGYNISRRAATKITGPKCSRLLSSWI